MCRREPRRCAVPRCCEVTAELRCERLTEAVYTCRARRERSVLTCPSRYSTAREISCLLLRLRQQLLAKALGVAGDALADCVGVVGVHQGPPERIGGDVG